MTAWIKLVAQLLAIAMVVYCAVTVGFLGHWDIASVILIAAFIVAL